MSVERRIEQPAVFEVSLCVGHDALHLACTAIDDVEVYLGVGIAAPGQLSAEDDHVGLVVGGAVGLQGSREWRVDGHADRCRRVVGGSEFGHVVVFVDDGIEQVLAHGAGQRDALLETHCSLHGQVVAKGKRGQCVGQSLLVDFHLDRGGQGGGIANVGHFELCGDGIAHDDFVGRDGEAADGGVGQGLVGDHHEAGALGIAGCLDREDHGV